MISVTGLDRVVTVQPALEQALDRVRDDGGAAGAAAGRVATPD
jgi:hypothetical protein